MEGGGKMAYGAGGGVRLDTKLLKSIGAVEPRKFGLGLFAGLLIVACAYFSTAKFDAVDIAMSKQPVKPQACKQESISSTEFIP
jgi:protein O-mannose beta-1,4-N-acetylglucosaminyltransferase